MLESETVGKVRPQGLHTVALRSLVACGEVIQTELARLVRRLFGDLSAEKRVDAKSRRLLNVCLGRPGAPGDGCDRTPMRRDVERLASQGPRY